MKVLINTEKFNVVHEWLCDKVGKFHGNSSWIHIGEGWSIRKITNHIDVWEVRVDFRRIRGPVQTEFMLRWA